MMPPLEIVSSTAPVDRAGPASCAACSLNHLCLPMGLPASELQRFDQIIGRRHRVRRDEDLYRMGDPFRNLFAIRLGHFKTYQDNPSGEQQITGFQMAGELLGMDAISSGNYPCGAVALEDSEVCEIPFARLEALFVQMPTLLRRFHRLMSQEIMREQSVMLLLGNMRAAQRFAVFLLNLASRYAARGYSSSRFQLRMSREDIGNYLGLTIESVSRALTSFKKNGWISIDIRELAILDRAGLEALAGGTECGEDGAAVPLPYHCGTDELGACLRPAQAAAT